ncbi:polysaccharide polymerase [Glaciimonas immobilis]|uniref:Putative polymerase n=1 Tax=Glaciimonas immobilis TaxID=728004 RepID=A0A840RLX8_9BURK|nr:polysaccharide polymerase [Glaciimonas immobilis]KAF3998020.1 polysaccharide polymerase [Glaciimonas immobilis]MBB5199297.1 putative polymerase [Glaciimonas immobilis]
MNSFLGNRNHSSPPADLELPAGQSLVFWILIISLTYQATLCAMHTNVHPISMLGVALTEAVIYLACLTVLLKRIRLAFFAVALLVAAYLFLIAIIRNQIDPKGFRDVMIPILFFGLGRQIGDLKYANRVLKVMAVLVIVFGFFELWFLEAFSRMFNIFSYYVSQGGLTAGTNWAKDSVLGLNGIRPEGIGRTILPSLLGNHRVSSIFLEPVSLGNFAVIIAAWGLSKRRDEAKDMFFFLAMAATMIALSDSRYGLITVGALVLMRCLPFDRTNAWMISLPLLSIIMLVVIGLFFNTKYGDNIIGRLYVSGRMLLTFDVRMLFGIEGFNIGFGDMGYSALLTRLGVVLCLFLWITFWMLKMEDERGNRFRAYITLYMSLILCVSGTSLFALKTAGILWFLVGCFVGRKNEAPRQSETLTSSAIFSRRNSYPLAFAEARKESKNVY